MINRRGFLWFLAGLPIVGPLINRAESDITSTIGEWTQPTASIFCSRIHSCTIVATEQEELHAYSVFRAVKNEAGEIVDYVYLGERSPINLKMHTIR